MLGVSPTILSNTYNSVWPCLIQTMYLYVYEFNNSKTIAAPTKALKSYEFVVINTVLNMVLCVISDL
jgi:hypothetical protein